MDDYTEICMFTLKSLVKCGVWKPISTTELNKDNCDPFISPFWVLTFFTSSNSENRDATETKTDFFLRIVNVNIILNPQFWGKKYDFFSSEFWVYILQFCKNK